MPTYYVSPTGSNAAGGTEAAPFATLPYAHGQANPGDVIYLRGGTYPVTTCMVLTRDGTSGNPISVFNYPGETPVFDAATMTVTGYYAGWLLQLQLATTSLVVGGPVGASALILRIRTK